jgi:hypothetical protein
MMRGDEKLKVRSDLGELQKALKTFDARQKPDSAQPIDFGIVGERYSSGKE